VEELTIMLYNLPSQGKICPNQNLDTEQGENGNEWQLWDSAKTYHIEHNPLKRVQHHHENFNKPSFFMMPEQMIAVVSHMVEKITD